MTFPTNQEIDIIAAQIVLDAKQALLGLQAFGKFTTDASERLRVLQRIVSQVAIQTGGDFKKAEMAVRRFSGAITGIRTEEIKLATNLASKANVEFKSLGDGAHSGITRALTAVNALRIALGVLVSMLIFQVIQAIQNTFRLMIENVRETELAVYNLINAERRLSEMGIGITPKDLQDIIDKLREINPILSQIQAEELVSRIATNVAPALKLTREQIEQMAIATSLLYIRNKALGKSFEEVESQLTNAFLTGKVSIGINQLGVKISDQIVRDEALRMGLVKTEEEFNKLSGEMEAHVKSVAMLSVVYKNAIQDQESMSEYMETTDAAIESSKKSWADLTTLLGKFFAPILGKSLNLVYQALEGIIMLLEYLKPMIIEVFSTYVAFLGMIEEFAKNPLMNRKEFFEKFKELRAEAVAKGLETLATSADTATNSFQDMYAAAEDSGDAEKALQDIEEKVQDIILDAQQAQQDLDLRLKQKEQDLDTEYLRKEEDAARDHAQKLKDIDLDAKRKAADAKAKLREDEKKAEQDLLQKLKELRQRFLLDLEEALHARDARQVLRLIREYKLEKQNLLDRKKLDDQQRKDKLAEDLKAIEIERLRRIETENIEYRRRLEDLAKAKAREQEELKLWYQREQEDIQRNIQQKLEKLIAGYIAEGKIHETEQAKIYAILAKYFAKDMALVDSLAQFMATRFAQIQSMSYIAPQPKEVYGVPQTLPGRAKTSDVFRKHNMAEGGTLIADRPTLAMFGENGAERADFTPLGRRGRDVGKVFSDMAGQGINGQILVSVDLSPDLEGRIVNRSMDGVAEVVGRVNRRKQ